MRKHLSACLAAAVILAAFFYTSAQYINHDVGWFMYAARGILNGGSLYQDYIDVNGPLAYLTLVPAAWLSNFISNEAALTLNVLVYIILSYALCAAVIAHMKLQEKQKLIFLCGILIILCFMPHFSFAQREHLLVVFMMPYVLAVSLRGLKKPLPTRLAIACGIAAAIAASIKLPYLVVPFVIEAAAFVRQKSKLILAPELVALIAAVILINLICFAAYPIYWTDILPSAVALYGPYNNINFIFDALLLQLPLFAFALAIGEYRGRSAPAAARWMMLAAIAGSFVLFVGQRKGWPHHSLPVLMFIAALCVLHVIDLPKDRLTARLRAAISGLALIGAFYLTFTGGNVDTKMITDVEKRVKDSDGSFWILSTGNHPAFPIALDKKYTWTSRFPQLILLPGLAQADLKGITSPHEAPFRKALLEDFQRGKPAHVFLFMLPDAGMPPGYDMLAWLRRDPGFDAEWKHYHQTEIAEPFVVFRRKY